MTIFILLQINYKQVSWSPIKSNKQVVKIAALTPVLSRARVLADEVEIPKNAEKSKYFAFVSVHKLRIEVEVLPNLVNFSARKSNVVYRSVVVDSVQNNWVEELRTAVAFDVVRNQAKQYSVI